MLTRVSLSFSSPMVWSSGELFNGFLLISLSYGKKDGVSWPHVTTSAGNRAIPASVFIPILNGSLQHNPKILPNSSILPPNSRYFLRYYDSGSFLISDTPVAQVINSNTVLSPPTPVAPTADTTPPAVQPFEKL